MNVKLGTRVATLEAKMGNVETALIGKQDTIGDDSLNIAHIHDLQTILDNKQNIITEDGGLDMSVINGLENALNSKQDIIEDDGLEMSVISGLEDALNSKQDIIEDDGLEISVISGLQTALDNLQSALDGKQAIIGDNGLQLRHIQGLQDALTQVQNALATKQTTIGDNGLHLRHIQGLQNALATKQAIIGDNGLQLRHIQGLSAELRQIQEGIQLLSGGTVGERAADINMRLLDMQSRIQGIFNSLRGIEELSGNTDRWLRSESRLENINQLPRVFHNIESLQEGIEHLPLRNVEGLEISLNNLHNALNGKQATIVNGDLTIAHIQNLQAALFAKQDIIGNGGLNIAHINNLQGTLDGKQATIGNGGLTIARTNGLQAALDGKQATIVNNSLQIAHTQGLQAILEQTQRNNQKLKYYVGALLAFIVAEPYIGEDIKVRISVLLLVLAVPYIIQLGRYIIEKVKLFIYAVCFCGCFNASVRTQKILAALYIVLCSVLLYFVYDNLTDEMKKNITGNINYYFQGMLKA